MQDLRKRPFRDLTDHKVLLIPLYSNSLTHIIRIQINIAALNLAEQSDRSTASQKTVAPPPYVKNLNVPVLFLSFESNLLIIYVLNQIYSSFQTHSSAKNCPNVWKKSNLNK